MSSDFRDNATSKSEHTATQSADSSSDTTAANQTIAQDNDSENPEAADNQAPNIPYRRDRTPSIIVQSLNLTGGTSSILTDSIESPGEDEEVVGQTSKQTELVSPAALDRISLYDPCDGSNKDSSPSKGSTSSQASAASAMQQPVLTNKTSPNAIGAINRRASLTITSTAPRRLSLTVEGMTGSLINQSNVASNYPSGSATGSLRNKVALKPGHSLMGWTKLASTAKDLSGTGGKVIEVTPEELAKHDSVDNCWVALNGNVYNVTTYLSYHPGGEEELMRGAGRDATDLFNEVHRWVNYESILAKCLIGPYKLESPSTPSGRDNFVTMKVPTSPKEEVATNGQSKTASDGKVVPR